MLKSDGHHVRNYVFNIPTAYDLKPVYNYHIWFGRHMIPYTVGKSDAMLIRVMMVTGTKVVPSVVDSEQ